MPETIIDTLVGILRRQLAAGTRVAPLSAATRDALFAAPVAAAPVAGRAEPSSPRPAVSPRPAAAPATSPPRPAAPRPAAVPAAAPASAAAPAATAVPEPLALAALGWDELQQVVRGCNRCPLCAERTQTVFGDGNRRAEIMFIGEAPGRDEDAQGIPFVGAAGQLLDKMITAMKFDRAEVYIANIVKCRPPRNRPPEAVEATTCLPFLKRQIELVQPKVIVTLGATPLQFLLGKSGIAREHGVWCEFAGIPALPTFHPAYLLRAPERKREAWEDLKLVMVRLGRAPAAPPRPSPGPAGADAAADGRSAG
jgi:DNA polymerase